MKKIALTLLIGSMMAPGLSGVGIGSRAAHATAAQTTGHNHHMNCPLWSTAHEIHLFLKAHDKGASMPEDAKKAVDQWGKFWRVIAAMSEIKGHCAGKAHPHVYQLHLDVAGVQKEQMPADAMKTAHDTFEKMYRELEKDKEKLAATLGISADDAQKAIDAAKKANDEVSKISWPFACKDAKPFAPIAETAEHHPLPASVTAH